MHIIIILLLLTRRRSQSQPVVCMPVEKPYYILRSQIYTCNIRLTYNMYYKCNIVRSEFIILFRSPARSSGPCPTRLPGEDHRAIPGSRATWRATNYMRFEGVVHEGAGRSRPEPVVRSNPFSPRNNNYRNLLTRRPIRPVLVLFSYTHMHTRTIIIRIL